MAGTRVAGVLFTLLTLSLALTFGPAPGPALAASTVYVDPADLCDGVAPCFVTIQEAVNNAGPAPAEVRVFPGTYTGSVNLSMMGSSIGETPGDLMFVTLAADRTPTPGTATVNGGDKPAFRTASTFPGSVSIDGFVVASLEEDGIHLVVRDDITILHVTANDNGDGIDEDDTGDDGVDARSTEGNIEITDSTASGNGNPAGIYSDGFELKAPNGDITLTRIAANDNNGTDDSDGVDIYDTGGNVTITDSTANDNSSDGFVVGAAGDITVVGTSVAENDGAGFDIYETGGAVSIEDSTATENAADGFGVYATAGPVALTNSTAIGNGDDGADLYTNANITVTGLTSLNNGLIDDTGDGLEAGFLSGYGNGYVSAGPLGNIGDINVRDSLVTGNKKHGVQFIPGITGNHSLTGSVFCDNEAGGLWLASPAGVSAEGNWWGAASGPTHPDNPGGTGQAVGDSGSDGDGEVDFTPWIDTITATEMPAPAAAVEGEPLAIGFQFADGPGTVFLEEGPGDPNGTGPFTTTTDNGTLTSSQGQGATVTEFIASDRVVVTLTPDHEGTATVTLAGPCDLESEITVTVLPGGLHGDVDCDDDVDSVDSLKILRHVAGLDVSQTEPCPDIGTGGPVFGDIDCDSDVDSVDSLRILRHVAGLPNNLGPGCGPVGT